MRATVNVGIGVVPLERPKVCNTKQDWLTLGFLYYEGGSLLTGIHPPENQGKIPLPIEFLELKAEISMESPGCPLFTTSGFISIAQINQKI